MLPLRSGVLRASGREKRRGGAGPLRRRYQQIVSSRRVPLPPDHHLVGRPPSVLVHRPPAQRPPRCTCFEWDCHLAATGLLLLSSRAPSGVYGPRPEVAGVRPQSSTARKLPERISLLRGPRY